jgi:hypothetical protein
MNILLFSRCYLSHSSPRKHTIRRASNVNLFARRFESGCSDRNSEKLFSWLTNGIEELLVSAAVLACLTP